MNKNYAIGFFALLVVGTLIGYCIMHKVGSELDQLKEALGSGILTPDGSLRVPFNGGDNFAQFYSNGRVIIFKKDGTRISGGNYSNGGKSLQMEDKGGLIESGSVWNNLLKTI